MNLLDYINVSDILYYHFKEDKRIIQNDKYVITKVNEYLRKIAYHIIDNLGYRLNVKKFRVSFYEKDKKNPTVIMLGVFEGSDTCIGCDEYFVVNHTYKGIDLYGIKGEYLEIIKNKISNLKNEATEEIEDDSRRGEVIEQIKIELIEEESDDGIGNPNDRGRMTTVPYNNSRETGHNVGASGGNMSVGGGNVNLQEGDMAIGGTNGDPNMNVYHRSSATIGGDNGYNQEGCIKENSYLNDIDGDKPNPENFECADVPDEAGPVAYGAANQGENEETNHIVLLASYDEGEDEVTLTENSIFAHGLKDDVLSDICKANTLYGGISDFVEIPRANYVRIWKYLINGISPDDGDKVKEEEWNTTSGTEYFMLNKGDDGKLQSLYFAVEQEQALVDIFPTSQYSLIICNPLSMFVDPITLSEDKIYVSYIEITPLDDLEANGIVLIGEAVINEKDAWKYYSEASLMQNIDNVLTGLKNLPGNVYKIINEMCGRLKGMIKAARKAHSDQEREDILNDEYFPIVESLLKTIATGAGSWVIGSMINPIFGLMALAFGVIAGNMHDKKKRTKAAQQLRDELDIIDEKINDAKSDGDKKAKYELMRLKKELLIRMDKVL